MRAAILLAILAGVAIGIAVNQPLNTKHLRIINVSLGLVAATLAVQFASDSWKE